MTEKPRPSKNPRVDSGREFTPALRALLVGDTSRQRDDTR